MEMKNAAKTIPIDQWAISERPRERLVRLGSTALSNSELFAILLGSGSKDGNALDVARELLRTTKGEIMGLEQFSVAQLMKIRGVGKAKATMVVACLEIARRFSHSPGKTRRIIKGSRDAYLSLKPFLADLEHEEFWVLYLNNANRLLECFQLSKGGITATLVDIRLVLKKALELNAVGLILAHNHPSGKLLPSKADLQITKKISKGASMFDVKVLDHLIVCEKEYYSFVDHQLI